MLYRKVKLSKINNHLHSNSSLESSLHNKHLHDSHFSHTHSNWSHVVHFVFFALLSSWKEKPVRIWNCPNSDRLPIIFKLTITKTLHVHDFNVLFRIPIIQNMYLEMSQSFFYNPILPFQTLIEMFICIINSDFCQVSPGNIEILVFA